MFRASGQLLDTFLLSPEWANSDTQLECLILNPLYFIYLFKAPFLKTNFSIG